MAARQMVFSHAVRLGPRDARTIAISGSRRHGARNIVALLLLAAVCAFRARVSWRRWQRRRRPALKKQ